jgi:RNA-directed DNA polymerase
VRDRVAQQAAMIVREPIFEADFLSCSYGFRPKRSALQTLETIRVGFIKGFTQVAEADIRGFFDNIDLTFSWRRWRGGSRTGGC